MTCVKHLGNDSKPPTPTLNTIGRAIPEIQKRDVYVQRYPIRDYCRQGEVLGPPGPLLGYTSA